MQIDYRRNGDIAVVFLKGEIDHHIAAGMRERIDEIIDLEEPKHLALDFEQVGMMDSSGIGIVLGRYRKMNEKGGRVAVINAKPIIKKIFDLSGVSRMIQINERGEEIEKGK